MLKFNFMGAVSVTFSLLHVVPCCMNPIKLGEQSIYSVPLNFLQIKVFYKIVVIVNRSDWQHI
jgi:hypothetical protein